MKMLTFLLVMPSFVYSRRKTVRTQFYFISKREYTKPEVRMKNKIFRYYCDRINHRYLSTAAVADTCGYHYRLIYVIWCYYDFITSAFSMNNQTFLKYITQYPERASSTPFAIWVILIGWRALHCSSVVLRHRLISILRLQ